MKKILLLLFFFMTIPAYANENSITQTQSTTSVINSSGNGGHTDVTVNNNGTVTHYSSDTGGSVNVKSVNGQTSITANGEPVTPSVSEGATPPQATITPITTVAKKINKSNPLDNLLEQLKRPFKIILSIFTIFRPGLTSP